MVIGELDPEAKSYLGMDDIFYEKRFACNGQLVPDTADPTAQGRSRWLNGFMIDIGCMGICSISCVEDRASIFYFLPLTLTLTLSFFLSLFARTDPPSSVISGCLYLNPSEGCRLR